MTLLEPDMVGSWEVGHGSFHRDRGYQRASFDGKVMNKFVPDMPYSQIYNKY